MSPSTLYRLRVAGTLPWVKVRNQVRFRPADIHALLESNYSVPAPSTVERPDRS